jgi:hypothetical protein
MDMRFNICAWLHEIQHTLHLRVLCAMDRINDALARGGARCGVPLGQKIFREFEQRAGKIGEGGHETLLVVSGLLLVVGNRQQDGNYTPHCKLENANLHTNNNKPPTTNYRANI